MVVFLVIEGCNPPKTICFGALPEKDSPRATIEKEHHQYLGPMTDGTFNTYEYHNNTDTVQ
jgi:hypothetical protein